MASRDASGKLLALANGVFLAGALAAYQTQLSIAMAAVMGLVMMLAAVLDIRTGPEVGRDRALSFVVGGLSLNAVLVVLPYLTVSAEGSLWDSRLFSGLEILVAGGSMVAGNYVAFTATGMPAAAQRLAQLHLLALAAAVLALYYIPDGTWVPVEANGYTTRMLDLRWSPVIAAAGALAWVVAALRPAAPS